MKVSFLKKDLLEGISVVGDVAGKGTTLPILANILIETDKDKVRVAATDLEINISCFVKANVLEEGGITVPGKKFGDIIRELPSTEEIVIQVRKNNNVLINCGKSFFKLMGSGKEDFPEIPHQKEEGFVNIEQGLLKHIINLTSFSVSIEDVRPALKGVLFVLKDNQIRFVATDGHRLALIEKKVDNKKGSKKEIIVPGKAICEVGRNLKEGVATITFNENQIQFQLNQTTLTSKLIEGNFPDYSKVIPETTGKQVLLNRDVFLSAVKRVSLLTSELSQLIRIDLFKNKLIVSSRSPELGEAKEEMDVAYDGEDISIGFYPRYLMDGLKNITDKQITLGLIQQDKPATIKTEEGYLYVVMPMELT